MTNLYLLFYDINFYIFYLLIYCIIVSFRFQGLINDKLYITVIFSLSSMILRIAYITERSIQYTNVLTIYVYTTRIKLSFFMISVLLFPSIGCDKDIYNYFPLTYHACRRRYSCRLCFVDIRWLFYVIFNYRENMSLRQRALGSETVITMSPHFVFCYFFSVPCLFFWNCCGHCCILNRCYYLIIFCIVQRKALYKCLILLLNVYYYYY